MELVEDVINAFHGALKLRHVIITLLFIADRTILIYIPIPSGARPRTSALEQANLSDCFLVSYLQDQEGRRLLETQKGDSLRA